jgi:hypothetical protein
MICPQEIFDEIIDLFEAQPNERNIIQHHIHRLIIRSCVSGESILESLHQFVSRGGVLKGENPGLILQYLASLGDLGFKGSDAGDRLPSGNGGKQSNGSQRWRCPVCGKKWGEGQVGAKAKGKRAMTGAERQRKYSDRKKNSQ